MKWSQMREVKRSENETEAERTTSQILGNFPPSRDSFPMVIEIQAMHQWKTSSVLIRHSEAVTFFKQTDVHHS
jgi:hypothetical protein